MKTLFAGIINLYTNGCDISKFDLHSLIFQSPHWRPDSLKEVVQNDAGFIAVNRYIFTSCQQAPSPFQMERGRFIIVGDAFLSNKAELEDKIIHLLDKRNNELGVLELILTLFLHYGRECTGYLKGEFCFVIWDSALKSLLLVSDQFGWKPLYYCLNQGTLLFSNCIFAFKKYFGSLSICEDYILGCLENFIIDEESTLYNEVFAVPRAHYVTIDSNRIEKVKYWKLKKKKIKYKRKEEYFEHANDLLKKAIAVRLSSPYKIGSHLSGGLDSSSLSAVSAQLLKKQNRQLFSYCAVPHPQAGSIPSVSKKITTDDRKFAYDLQAMYSNLSLDLISADLNINPMNLLEEISPFVGSLPVNMLSTMWLYEIQRTHVQRGGRLILSSVGGNCTLSHNPASSFGQMKRNMKCLLKMFSPYFLPSSRSFSKSHFYLDEYSKALHKLEMKALNELSHYRNFLCTRAIPLVTRFSSIVEFYSGCYDTDPMWDMDLVTFSYGIPRSLMREEMGRMLIRNMMTNQIPDSIRLRNTRGEQAADWRLWFSLYFENWRTRIYDFNSKSRVIDIAKITDFITSTGGCFDSFCASSRCKANLLNAIFKQSLVDTLRKHP